MQLQTFFERAAILARREGMPFTATDKELSVPVENVRRYLMLDRDDMAMRPHFGVRIGYNLKINPMSCPAVTRGFESSPEQKLVYRAPSQFKDPMDDDQSDDEYLHASQSIIVTDYRKPTGQHGFAVMIQDRMISYYEDLPVLFGFHGNYGKGGMLSVRRLAVPVFGVGRKIDGLQDIAVTKENIIQALTYARLCADQIYYKEYLTPFKNWKKAIEICKEPEPVAQSPVPG